MNKIKIYKKLINEWVDSEKIITCGDEMSKRYKKVMMKRWQYLYDLCTFLKPDKSIDVLDVGRSHFSQMLAEYYNNTTTLGFDLADDGGHRELDECNLEHIVFDLKKASDTTLWPNGKNYDIIIYSEVIEHLNEAPEYSLLFLKYLLKPDGILICSTPNAAAIHKRLKMGLGFNPYEKIRFFNNNPGHFREYTRQELYEMGNKCGLNCIFHRYENFFTHDPSDFYTKLTQKLFSAATAFVPSWKNQQIIVFKNSHVSDPVNLDSINTKQEAVQE
ncbi:MAG: class I SAM-dependent methyltransferase [candidate division Zixibacteria bacterium]|nr:class I SAM-dependent methyltransferase [candidate division Zixibacteria bacterium]